MTSQPSESETTASPYNEEDEALFSGYFNGHPPEDLPLADYAKLAAIFNATLIGLFLAAEKSNLPERMEPYDVLLLGLATHKMSRLISKDRFNAPFRAPFARYVRETGAGEVDEEARGTGMRRALGLLLTRPWCTGPWVAPLLALCLVRAPRRTRLVSGVFAALTISDFLHHFYELAKKAKQ